MVLKQKLRTREDQFDMLERTVAAIMKAGQMVEKAGTIIQAVNTARAILADKEKTELFEERMKALEELNGIVRDVRPAKETGADKSSEE